MTAPVSTRKHSANVAAAADPSALLTAATVAALTGFAAITIRQWSRKGRFPDPVLIGRAVRWRARDVHRWMDERGITPPVDYAASLRTGVVIKASR